MEKEERNQADQRKRIKQGKEREIRTTEHKTEDKIDQRTAEMIKILELKEENSIAETNMKETVLRKNFRGTVERLITKIKMQRDMILQAYGPLVLSSKQEEPPIFSIQNKDSKDKFLSQLQQRRNVP